MAWGKMYNYVINDYVNFGILVLLVFDMILSFWVVILGISFGNFVSIKKFKIILVFGTFVIVKILHILLE